MNDPGAWQGMAGEERVEAGPREPCSPRSPFQPSMPRLRDLLAIPAQLPDVPRNAVVGIVTGECHRQPSCCSRIGRCRLFRHQSAIAVSARARRPLAVVCRTTSLPFRDLTHVWVKPRKSNVGLPSGVPPWRCGRKSMKRVLVGCSVSPNRPKRFPSTSRTRSSVVVGLEGHHEVIGKPHPNSLSRSGVLAPPSRTTGPAHGARICSRGLVR